MTTEIKKKKQSSPEMSPKYIYEQQWILTHTLTHTLHHYHQL